MIWYGGSAPSTAEAKRRAKINAKIAQEEKSLRLFAIEQEFRTLMLLESLEDKKKEILERRKLEPVVVSTKPVEEQYERDPAAVWATSYDGSPIPIRESRKEETKTYQGSVCTPRLSRRQRVNAFHNRMRKI